MIGARHYLRRRPWVVFVCLIVGCFVFAWNGAEPGIRIHSAPPLILRVSNKIVDQKIVKPIPVPPPPLLKPLEVSKDGKFVGLSNGVLMPRLGVGTAALGAETSGIVVQAALDAGYRHIDTASEVAQWYKNEKAIGEVVRDAKPEVREKTWLTTKLHPQDHGVDTALASLQASIENLGHVDLYLIHFPECFGDICAHPPQGTWEESYQVMEAAFKDGKIKAIGVSNFDLSLLKELVGKSEVKPHVVQNWCDPFHQDRPIRQWCKDNEIVYTAYSSLGTQWGARGKPNPVFKSEVLKGIASSKGKSVAQVVLRWQLQSGIVVIPRSRTTNHLKENADIFSWSLNDEEMKKINDLDGTEGRA